MLPKFKTYKILNGSYSGRLGIISKVLPNQRLALVQVFDFEGQLSGHIVADIEKDLKEVRDAQC